MLLAHSNIPEIPYKYNILPTPYSQNHHAYCMDRPHTHNHEREFRIPLGKIPGSAHRFRERRNKEGPMISKGWYHWECFTSFVEQDKHVGTAGQMVTLSNQDSPCLGCMALFGNYIWVLLRGALYFSWQVSCTSQEERIGIGTVTHAPPMQVARAWHTAAASSSALFVFGGIDSRLSQYSFASCEMFTIYSNQ